MAKRKKQSKSKAQKRATQRRGNSAKRGKARKAAQAKATKRTVAKAKPKRTPVKKAAQRIKQPVVATIETTTVEVIEQPGVIAVTEVEETEVRKAS
jgi:trimethylamine:corrinoid methyltransferase-like protein